MLKRFGLAAVIVAAVFLCGKAFAAPAICKLTGNLTDLYGNAAANARVTFDTTHVGVQNGSNSNQQIIVPSIQTVYTDSNGNLPAGTGCQPASGASVCLVQGETVDVTVGLHGPDLSYYSALPVRVQVPLMSTADLTTLILAGTDPSSLLSQLNIGAGGDFKLSVVNPAVGNIGIATLTPGSVTGIQSVPICTTAPATNQFLGYNGTNWCPSSTLGNITASSSGGPYELIGYKAAGTYDPRGYGALLDGENCQDLTFTNNSKTVSSAGCSNFTGRAGESIALYDPSTGLRLFNDTIASVTSSTQITLTDTYTGSTYSGNGGAIYGNDDGALTNAFINSKPINSTFTIKLPPDRIMVVSTPIQYNGRNVRFLGSGAFLGGGTGAGQGTSSQTGSIIVPIFHTLPTPNTVFYIVDTWGAELGNLAIAGDNLYNRTLDGVQTLRNASLPGSDFPQTQPYLHDLFIGYINGTSFTSNTVSEFLHGINALGAGAQNDVGRIDRVNVSHTTFGVSWCPDTSQGQACQATQWGVHHFTCNRVSVCFDAQNGAIVDIDEYQDLSVGIDFALGNAAHMSVKNMASEHDGSQVTWAPPWKALWTYPRNYTIQGSDSSLHMVTTSGTSGTSEPTWSSSCSSTGSTCTDNTVTWTTVSSVPSLIATAIGVAGNIAGTLKIGDSSWDVNGWLPVYGTPISALMSSDGGDMRIDMADVTFINNMANPPPSTPVIDLSTSGSLSRTFRCLFCPGLGLSRSGNVNVALYTAASGGDSRTSVEIDVRRPPGYPARAGADLGESFTNVLINGAAPDNYRLDFAGEVNALGALLVPQLAAPASMFSITCSAGTGSNTYKYKATALNHLGETVGSAEATMTCAGAIGVSGVTAQGNVMPVPGADHYKIYRTVAGGASNSEHFAVQIVADAVNVSALGPNSFLDNVADGSLGAAIPTINTTGYLTAGGTVSIGGDLTTTSSPPTLTAGCNGTGSSITGTDYGGVITTQSSSAATTCTLTKSGAACPNAYDCQFSDANGSTSPLAYSAGAATPTTAIVDFASATSAKIHYQCSCR